MDEKASPELLEANRRLYELRAHAQERRKATGLPAVSEQGPAGVSAGRAALEPGDDVDAQALAERIAALPEHLGWGSVALTAVIRRQQRSARRPGDSVHPADDAPAQLVEDARGAADEAEPAIIEKDRIPRGKQVKLYPDIGLAMLRQEQTAAGRLWLLLRYLDGAGEGVLRIVVAQQTLTTPTSMYYLCSKRQLRNLLKAGEGIFWTRDSHRIWLHSAARVAHALGVVRLTGRPVTLPVSALLSGIGAFRANLYAAFHGSRIRETTHGPVALPISRATLAKLSGVGVSSQRTYEARTGVEVKANYAIGAVATKEAKENYAWQHGRAVFELRDHRGQQGREGQVYVAWQLPNSYVVPNTQHPKGRQKRINRKLNGLVEKGMPGNVERAKRTPKPTRCYFPNGKLASRARERSPGRKQYWPMHAITRGPHVLWHHLG